MKKTLILATALMLSAGAWAKLPPLSDEAKAKAAEAAAKTAHGDKVAAYQLCKSREKVAAHYYKTNGKGKPAPTATPACVDPGAYQPLDATMAAAPAAAKPGAAPAPAPVPAPAPAKKG